MAALTPTAFETINPSRYITFTLPINPIHTLQIAVLDSPSAAEADATTAAMWIPSGRESDWIFSTFSGHLQLLISSPTPHPLSRLILLGNLPSHPHPVTCGNSIKLTPLLLALAPKSANRGRGDGEIPEVPLLIYEDGVFMSSILEICEGPCVGEMLVENVELENDGVREFRRRLRFKRMPNLVQTQMRILPRKEECLEKLGEIEFELDKAVLVQPYLSPMVAGISVVSKSLQRRMQAGFRPKVLCLGVGGGALLGFLSAQLNFEVVGVEEDEAVLGVAKRHFGLESDESIHLFVEDGIKYVKDLAKDVTEGSRFDVVMVDLDSNDAALGVCAAPPLEFGRHSVLLAVRDVLFEGGVLVINSIRSSKWSHESLIGQIQGVFEELYQIDVGNEENFVLIATKSKIESSWDAEDEGSLLNKLKLVVPRSYIASIGKISNISDSAFRVRTT